MAQQKRLDVITKLDLSHCNAQASGKRLEEEERRRFRGGEDSMTAGDPSQVPTVAAAIPARVRKE
jgi:hypothetical protein